LVWLERLRTSSPSQQIEQRVARRKARGIALVALSAETGLTTDALRRHIRAATQSGDLLLIHDDLLLSRDAFLEAVATILTRLQTGAQAIKSSELRGQTALGHAVFDFVLSFLVRERRAQLHDEMVSLYNAGDRSSNAESEHVTTVANAYLAAGLAAPSVVELAQRLGFKEADMRCLITTLQRNKTIVRMGSDDLFIHSSALQQLVALLAPLRGSLMDVAHFKRLTGLSRKYAIPLLEYLDRLRITRKQDDQRLVL
jgi:selenocysteine-specific elongation factor